MCPLYSLASVIQGSIALIIIFFFGNTVLQNFFFPVSEFYCFMSLLLFLVPNTSLFVFPSIYIYIYLLRLPSSLVHIFNVDCFTWVTAKPACWLFHQMFSLLLSSLHHLKMWGDEYPECFGKMWQELPCFQCGKRWQCTEKQGRAYGIFLIYLIVRRASIILQQMFQVLICNLMHEKVWEFSENRMFGEDSTYYPE